ncbi:NucA/NucB deoxyribonuclease domain-containing protein [Phytohabitans rumicis]|uniref:Deoxyribonuclease NucA/NucB domain-containing protein n=1 Tax=Phytohabitans rumicis TaxID=1076125 RepID=A0A6V8L0L0_9ACTN|nr:hypothetical protein [Phytohabitans rumicis]GFJ88518.1 hypothetical protein Prum_021600 [Phytohabitans rumicis]
MRASRSVAAAIVAAVVLLAPASPAAAAPAEKQSYTRLTVTTPEGKALPKTPRAPKSDKEKRRITPETPQRAKLRTDYLATLEDRVQATDFVNMTECWGAFGAGLGGQVTLNHFTWCSLGYLTIEDVLCSNGSCKVQGSIVFRLSVQGMGHQGSHSTDDRKTRVWVLLDEPVVTGAPRMDRRLKLNGTCSSSTAGTSCDVTEDGDTATLTQWMLAGSTYFTFVLPAGNVDGADRIAYGDFMIKANILDNPIGYESWIMGPESGFRCDSSSKVSYYGCVYPDVIEQFWLKATPDVAQEAAHVWRAQNQPNTTLPLPMAGKSIPGSRNSGSPLERLTDETTKKANNDKSRRFCQRYWGRGYSQNNTKQCDEYPFQSTWQGSSIGGDGTSHFSVDVIDTSHNRVGGEHLNKFYNERRIIEQDKFYVDVLTADGKPYGRTDAFPTGPITPIEYPQCENSALPEIEEVETKAAPQDLFNNYAENTPDGWTGATPPTPSRCPTADACGSSRTPSWGRSTRTAHDRRARGSSTAHSSSRTVTASPRSRAAPRPHPPRSCHPPRRTTGTGRATGCSPTWAASRSSRSCTTSIDGSASAPGTGNSTGTSSPPSRSTTSPSRNASTSCRPRRGWPGAPPCSKPAGAATDTPTSMVYPTPPSTRRCASPGSRGAT